MKNARKQTIPVSRLKAELLEYVRQVERGESYEITKDGKTVARLVPAKQELPAVGFAQIQVLGSLDLDLSQDWLTLKAAEPGLDDDQDR